MKPWFCLLILLSLPAAQAQDAPSHDALKHLLDVSQHRSQLDTDGSPPFHLVASYEQFDSDGKTVWRGTLDELWVNPRRYRQTLTVPAFEEIKSDKGTTSRQVQNAPPRELVEVDSGSKAWRTGRWILFADILDPLIRPISPRLNVSDRLTVQPGPTGTSELECVGVEPELQGVPSETAVALTSICMARGNHLLKVINLPNDKAINFNGVQPFGDKYIARSISAFTRGKLAIKIHVDLLEQASDSSELDVPIPDTAQVLPFHRADLPHHTGQMMVGQLLTKVNPLYPSEGLRGSITVKLHVGTNGVVDSATVLQAENQALKAPVLTALKAWRFRVSYQGTKPVGVDRIYRFSFGGAEELQ